MSTLNVGKLVATSNVKLPSFAGSANYPSSPEKGMLIFDSIELVAKLYSGAATDVPAGAGWISVGTPGLVVPSAVLGITTQVQSNRVVTSASSNVTQYSFGFTKQSNDSILLATGLISAAGNDNDGLYYFTDISGTRKYDGWAENLYPTYAQYYSLQFHQIWTGVSAGSKTFSWGWEPINGSSNRPVNVYNINNSEDGRNRQNGSEFVIWELKTGL